MNRNATYPVLKYYCYTAQLKGLCVLTILLPAAIVLALFGTSGLMHESFEQTRREREHKEKHLEYVAAATRHSGSFHTNESCSETFNATFEDNLKVIQGYPRGQANKYMLKIGGKRDAPLKMAEFPVIVTAMTRHFYPKSQGLFQSVHTKMMKNPMYKGKVHMIVYDLGLTERQRKVLQERCLCELRRFPFESFPEHVKTVKYNAWKPLIIQTLLMEFGFIWWVDTSVRFTTDNIDTAIQMAKHHGVLFRVSHDDPDMYSVAKQTAVETFKYLGEDPCKYGLLGQVRGGLVLAYFNRVSKTIINAWASCALNLECIAPVSLQQYWDVNVTRDSRYHRFDQSVLSIIVRRLYHKHNTYPFTDVMANVTVVKSDIVSFLEKCEPPSVKDCFL